MFKYTATYMDYNGTERTMDCLFNLNKAEVFEMELMTEGGMQQLLDRIVKVKDTVELGKLMKMFIEKSYGIKSPDGNRFIKDPDKLKEFEQTEAYSDFYVKIVTDAKFAASFINGIIPQVDIPDEEKPAAQLSLAE